VGVFSIDNPNDGTLSGTELITVTVRNFGLNEESNVPVSYQVDGGALVNEVVTETIPSSGSVQFTFVATADMSAPGTYTITSSTALGGDENPDNDASTKMVTNYPPDDLGVIAIVAPLSGENLTNAEQLVVTIENFGGVSQSDFDVTFDIDENSVTETVAGPLAELSTMDYVFTATGDFSSFGSYNVSAYTSLPDDFDLSNDTSTAVVTNTMCQPVSNCTVGDGIRYFSVGTIDNVSDCEPDGFGDFTFLSTVLDTGSTNELTITTGYGNQFVRVWIDYNDNFAFELNELVVDNYEIADGQGAGTYTETMDLVVPGDATLGEHIMRAKTNWNNPVPDDACEETAFGETEEYTAIIDYPVGIIDQALLNEDLNVAYLPGDQYKITLTTSNFSERLIFTVHDIHGRKLVQNWVENTGGVYVYELDMSYAPAGVYLIRLGTENIGKVKRIVVK